MRAAGDSWLRGRKVAFAGRLASLTRAEAAALLRARGGEYSANLTRQVSLLVLGQEGWPIRDDGRLTPKLHKARRLQAAGCSLTVLSEEEFLSRLGFGPQSHDVHRLYSTAQLCRLLRVSRARIRTWVRAGLIQPADSTHGVNYFDFQQVTSARTLVDLTRAGVKPEQIRRSLELLQAWLPDLGTPLAQLAVIERGGQLLVRLEQGQLAEPTGQAVFDFGDEGPAPEIVEARPSPRTAEQWFDLGCSHEAAGRLADAAEAYRQTLLLSAADVRACFNLANVLYAQGKKERAAERYRQVVELDHGYIEAWNNLGNVLAELGAHGEAVTALRRVLKLNPHFADAHYNLADALDAMGRSREAAPHWQAYLRSDPASQWGVHARRRLRQVDGLR